MQHKSRMGRPVLGGEAKSVEVRVRIEPYLYKQMLASCRQMGMTRSAFVRYAIEQLIRSVRQHYY